VIYHLYGVRLHSAWALPYSRAAQPYVADIALTRRAAPFFSAARSEAERQPQRRPSHVEGQLADRRTYLCWPGQFEFLISADGRQIAGRPLRNGTVEGFHTYLLGQALSFALIGQGLDPLHATVVTIDGGAAAFLGDSGYGKSSLAAAFIGAGHRLLTDDLLIVTSGPGGLAAHPGPPRLKLYPQSARRLLPSARGARMMRSTPKLLFRLSSRQVAPGPAGLRVMYVITPPGSRPTQGGAATARVTIRRLGARQACLALLRNTFNTSVRDPDRLARQFALTVRLASSVAVKSVSYPRSFRVLPDVRDAILADLQRESSTVATGPSRHRS
jgi:hypothetical protein